MRILCFGDSLTEGLHRQIGQDFMPYGRFLEALLKEYLTDENISVRIFGKSGWLVNSLKDHIKGLTEEGYDWVIILAGTNDIGHMRPADEIVNNIRFCHSTSLASSSRTIACTIPEAKHRFAPIIEKRDFVNAKIREYAASESDVYLCDLYVEQPFWEMSKEEQKAFWESDGLHFTPAGYERMAKIIFGTLKSVLEGTYAEKHKSDAKPQVKETVLHIPRTLEKKAEKEQKYQAPEALNWVGDSEQLYEIAKARNNVSWVDEEESVTFELKLPDLSKKST